MLNQKKYDQHMCIKLNAYICIHGCGAMDECVIGVLKQLPVACKEASKPGFLQSNQWTKVTVHYTLHQTAEMPLYLEDQEDLIGVSIQISL